MSKKNVRTPKNRVAATPITKKKLEEQFLKEYTDKEKRVDDAILTREYSRTARASKLNKLSLEEYENYIDHLIEQKGERPQSLEAYRHWLLKGNELEKFNAYFDWFFYNEPLTLAYARTFLSKMRDLAQHNLFMTASVDFNRMESGFFIQDHLKNENRRTQRERERGATPPHPIVTFIAERPGKRATFCEIKAACPDVKHLHSYLHYLTNKKQILRRVQDYYEWIAE